MQLRYCLYLHELVICYRLISTFKKQNFKLILDFSGKERSKEKKRKTKAMKRNTFFPVNFIFPIILPLLCINYEFSLLRALSLLSLFSFYPPCLFLPSFLSSEAILQFYLSFCLSARQSIFSDRQSTYWWIIPLLLITKFNLKFYFYVCARFATYLFCHPCILHYIKLRRSNFANCIARCVLKIVELATSFCSTKYAINMRQKISFFYKIPKFARY